MAVILKNRSCRRINKLMGRMQVSEASEVHVNKLREVFFFLSQQFSVTQMSVDYVKILTLYNFFIFRILIKIYRFVLSSLNVPICDPLTNSYIKR